MSTSEYSGEHPDPLSADPNPPEPDYLAADDDIPSDPLLSSDRFIDADVDEADEDQQQTLGAEAPNGDAENTRESSPDKPAANQSCSTADQGEGPTTVPAAEANSESTPPPAEANASTPAKRRSSSKRVVDVASMQERPEWLPKGWSLDYRIRSSGATAGTTDKYYVEPGGRRFRSKKEVFHFLETGGKLKRKANPDDVMPSENSGGHKQKKSASKAKIPAPPKNFDYANPPEEVSWVLTDVSTDTWKPFIGDEKVPESTRKEWDATFEYLNTRKSSGSK